MADIPAISGFDDASAARVVLLQSDKMVHAPALEIGLQPLDAMLTALAALVTVADRGLYFTGADAPALFTLTAAGRAILDDADAAAQRTTLGLGTGDTPNFADLVGTVTNDNAAAGNIGEVISSTVAIASAVALTTNITANVTSISLTAGDWDVYGSTGLSPAATTSITYFAQSISLTSATLDTTNPGRLSADIYPAIVVGASAFRKVYPSMALRLSLSATTTVYLVANSTFTIAANAAYGQIWARRAR